MEVEEFFSKAMHVHTHRTVLHPVSVSSVSSLPLCVPVSLPALSVYVLTCTHSRTSPVFSRLGGECRGERSVEEVQCG